MNNEGFEQEREVDPQAETAKAATPAKESSLVDEIIFSGNADEAFTEPEETQEVKPTETEEPGTKPSNDDAQYQYWQSQADKARNENEQMKAELEQLKAQSQKPAAPEPEKQTVEEPEQFPDPPEKPQEPAGFSREEAYSDPYSESAKYLNTKEQWRDDMTQYNTLRSEYNSAVQQQSIDNMNHQQQQQREAYEQYARQKAVMDNVRQTVGSKYGADSDTVESFIKEMSKPEAISLDNLWKLYNLNHGQKKEEPSPTFKQTQNVQQVPSPMGVMPSSNNQAGARSAEDIIMDGLIKDYKGTNPFG